MDKDYPLFFIRHGKLSLPYKDHSEIPFSVLVDLGLKKLDPAIDDSTTRLYLEKIKTKIPLKDIDRIYISPSRRCQGTSELINKYINDKYDKDVEIRILDNLKEIKFDLGKLFSSEKDKSLANINKVVLEAIIKGGAVEPFDRIYKRVNSLFRELDKENKSGKYLLITHDFIMRVIEVYIKNKGKKNISLTIDDIKDTKRNDYLEGFKTNFSLSLFSAISSNN